MLQLLLLTAHILCIFGAERKEFIIQSRIIGGSYCDTSYPEVNYKFMVSLRTYDEEFEFYEHFCGGTLVKEYWILTAGHCSKPGTMYAVEAYRIDDLEYTGAARKIAARIPHPKFNNETNANDIALLLLSTPMFKSDKVSYVTLPYLPIRLEENKCSTFTVMGWGQTTKDLQGKWFPPRLECLELSSISLEECKAAHEQHKRNQTVGEGNLCTEASTSKDFWRGDSGGPLICGDVQYGIISWGYGAQGYPSVYTRVDKYLDFIKNNICRAPGA